MLGNIMAGSDINKNQVFVSKLLASQINESRTSHAYLFCGPTGCGKFITAKNFAKKLLQNTNFDYQIDNDIHPDVKIYEPKGVSSYLTSQIQEIIKDSFLAPVQANMKIYILKHVEKLGDSASNAFLKTLEEPPKNVCFILLANSKESVMFTIVSRCQILSFQQIPKDQQIDYVVTNSGASSDDAIKSIELYGGNLEKAISFCLNQELQNYISLIEDVIVSLDDMTDWQTLQQTALINNKSKLIIDQYQDSLQQKADELSEILENSAISIIEEQNKRNVGSKQVELSYLLCVCIQLYYRKQLNNNAKQDFYIKRLNLISKMQQDLSYNINKQNFCDVLFLNLKRIN